MHDDPPESAVQVPPDRPGWERNLIERFAFESLREQRRARRWSVFFKLALVAYLLVLLLLSAPDWKLAASFGSGRISAVVNVDGVIADGLPASADNVITGLRAAFEHAATKGVIVRINSPGGSPVQAGYINDEIYRLKAEYPDTPVYAVIRDICASGGYYVAAAADQIYADKASIVGSIGVRMDGFGFVEALDKLGIERRLLTAGEHKGFLDPFSPLDGAEVAHVSRLLGEIHQQFVNTVEKGRRDKLKRSPELYSGLVWTGEKSLALGLIDGLGSSGYVARELIGAEELVDFTPHQGLLDHLARRLGAQLSAVMRTALKPGW